MLYNSLEMIVSLTTMICWLALYINLNGCDGLLEDGEGTLNNKRLGCINLNNKINETIARTKIITPSDLSGQWVSTDCETRNGQQYLLRNYTFRSTGTVHLVQIYYSDDSCTKMTFVLTANGTYDIRSRQLNKIGTVELNYDFNRVTVKPNDPRVANELANKLRMICPEIVHKGWRHYREYDIFNAAKGRTSSIIEQNTVKRDNTNNNNNNNQWSDTESNFKSDFAGSNDYQKCLSALDIDLSELRFVRIQLKPRSFKNPSSEERKELLFPSANPSLYDRKKVYWIPFQLPLVLPQENPECHVCQSLATSDPSHIPPFHQKVPLHTALNGDWISTGCDVRPLSDYFTMKHVRINSGSGIWQTEYRVYSNNNCTHLLMTYWLTGNFIAGLPSNNSRAFDLDFVIENAKVVIKDGSILNTIREDKLCNLNGYWKIGTLKELPNGQGCPSLGILTPKVRYDVAKVDVDVDSTDGSCILFLGEQIEIPAFEISSSEAVKYRPTSYQYTLIQCSEHPFHSTTNSPRYTPTGGYTHHVSADDKKPPGGDAKMRIPNAHIIVFCTILYATMITFIL